MSQQCRWPQDDGHWYVGGQYAGWPWDGTDQRTGVAKADVAEQLWSSALGQLSVVHQLFCKTHPVEFSHQNDVNFLPKADTAVQWKEKKRDEFGSVSIAPALSGNRASMV